MKRRAAVHQRRLDHEAAAAELRLFNHHTAADLLETLAAEVEDGWRQYENGYRDGYAAAKTDQ